MEGDRPDTSAKRPIHPAPDEIARLTDHYFNKSKAVAQRFGDAAVTYAVFLRRPVISAPSLAIEWLEGVAAARGTKFEIDLCYAEGAWVGAGQPLLYISGSLVELVDLETIYLQKI